LQRLRAFDVRVFLEPLFMAVEFRGPRVRQLNAQVVDCYEPWFKNVYYKRESCCG
jgi:hypothetical protein